MKVLLWTLLSIALFAKEVYIVDTPQCQVYFEEGNNTLFYEKGVCGFKNTDIVIDNLRYVFQLRSKRDISPSLRTNKATEVEYKGKKLLGYELGRGELKAFTNMPKYTPLYIREKKYMFISNNVDMVLLEPFDEKVYEKRKKLFCAIPQNIKVKKIADTVTLQTLLVEKILLKKGFKRSDDFVQKLLYKQMDYKVLVEIVLANLGKEKGSEVLINMFDGRELLETMPFDEKLKFFKVMQETGVQNQYQIFTLYRVLSNGYFWSDAPKELKLQMQNIDYFKKHYQEYKSLIIDNQDKENHLQPDIYAEVMILAFKQEIKDKKLLQSYIDKMREFERFFQKDITNHSMQTLLTTLSDERIDEIEKGIVSRLQKEYERKVKANKKMLYTLVVTNYKINTFIFIKIKLDAKYAPKILKTLQEKSRVQDMNSKYSEEFTPDMTKKQIIQKIIKKYDLSENELKIVKVDMTVRGKKIRVKKVEK